MSPWFMLGLQIALAALALHVLARQVYPALGRVRQGELIVDVWLPLALVIPLLFLVEGVQGTVRDAGWPAFGGPVICGVIALAIAAIIGRGGIGVLGEEFAEGEAIGWRLAPRLTVAGLLGGMTLLLIGAAHVLTLWVGLASFALAAVLLWINTPETDRDRTPQTPEQFRAGLGMLLVILLAFGHGLVGRMTDMPMRWLVVIVMLSYLAIALAMAARQASAGLCMRLGVWAASLGTLFALGVTAMLAMLPHVIETFTGIFAVLLGIEVDAPVAAMDFSIAAGFGIFALEATVLMILTPIAVGLLRLPPIVRVVIGVLLLALVAARVAWWAA